MPNRLLALSHIVSSVVDQHPTRIHLHFLAENGHDGRSNASAKAATAHGAALPPNQVSGWRWSEMPISSRSQGLKTVIPPIPNSTLRCDHPLTLLSEPLAEPPDPHGDHYQAANRKSTGQNVRANGGTI